MELKLMDGIPDGWQEIEGCTVHISDDGTKLVITGRPLSEDDHGYDDNSAHHCDMMGCGSCDHVLFRAEIILFGR